MGQKVTLEDVLLQSLIDSFLRYGKAAREHLVHRDGRRGLRRAAEASSSGFGPSRVNVSL
jgi:hypothetical protein